MSLTNQKIRVASAKINEAVQRDLFQQGYEWRSIGKNTQHTHASFLYAHEDGRMSYGADADPRHRELVTYLRMHIRG